MKLHEILTERVETDEEKQKRAEKKKKKTVAKRKVTRAGSDPKSPNRREESKRAKGASMAAGLYKNAGDWKRATRK